MTKAISVLLIWCLIVLPMFDRMNGKRVDRSKGSDGSVSVHDSLETTSVTSVLFLTDQGKPQAQPPERIWQAREEARELAKERWTKERWMEEYAYDRGQNFRTAGTAMGFTLGAAAGMLIGMGFQGRKVERTEYQEGWGPSEGWTKEFYSYEHKYAPHLGAALGGIGGAFYGHTIGKKADKEYFILVPRAIRTQKTKSRWLENVFTGFGLLGPAMGFISGRAMFTEASGRQGEGKIEPGGIIIGYLLGSVSGTIYQASVNGRKAHESLWEAEVMSVKSGTSFNIQMIPLNTSALRINAINLPTGESVQEVQIDILQVRF